MLKLIYTARHYFEKHGFDVSSRFSEKLGLRVKNVRLVFIYLSFATLGLGFAIYITMAFLLQLKDLIYTKRSSVFDLWNEFVKSFYNHKATKYWLIWGLIDQII